MVVKNLYESRIKSRRAQAAKPPHERASDGSAD